MPHTEPVGLEPLRPVDRLAAGRISDRTVSNWLHAARVSGAGRVQGDADSDTATAQTVAVMVDQARSSARDPEVMRAAFDAARRFRGGPLYQGEANSPAALARSCWWWAKEHLRFELHDALIREWLQEGEQLQLLISPDVLVRMQDRRGDCAIFTELICSFLTVLGVPWEIVTAAVNPREPGVFSHVYPRAILPDGSRLALDASHGRYPGWQVPSAHVSKLQVWDMDGAPVPDRGSRWAGLHDYRGLGDAGDAFDGDSFGGGNSTSLPDPFGWFGNDAHVSTPIGTPAPAPAGGGFNWDSFVGGLANQWSTIGGRILAPTTEIRRGANGQLSIVTPNSPTAATAAAAGSAALGSGGGISPTLMLAGLGVLLVVMMTSSGKR